MSSKILFLITSIDYYGRSVGVRAYYLPQPFYRYGQLCPRNYLKKLEMHQDLYHDPHVSQGLRDTHTHVQAAFDASQARAESVREFWERARVYFDTLNANQKPSPTEYAPRHTIRELDTHPRVMAHALNHWEYDWQASRRALETYV